jgi:hypothetical protein
LALLVRVLLGILQTLASLHGSEQALTGSESNATAPCHSMHSDPASSGATATIRFTVFGLIALCISLIVTSTLITLGVGRHLLGQAAIQDPVSNPPTLRAGASQSPSPPIEVPPWGELLTLDIELEQPAEYVSFEQTTKVETRWVFSGCTVAQTRVILEASGMSPAMVEESLAAEHVEDTPSATVLRPEDSLVISLPADVRAKLYSHLAKWPVNNRMANPYHLPAPDFSALFAEAEVPREAVEMVKTLSYALGGGRYFSDLEVVLHMIPSPDTRLQLLKMLTYQTAVLARIRLRPDSDLDKLLGYWGTVPGVRSKDLRPLLESVCKTPDGGSLSLLYFLPAFARERLFTYPMPSSPGDVKMDCHWSALNFFSETPDSRFQDNEFASRYIKENCYSIGKPSRCGDLVFLVNRQDEVVHSAVYIADDLVFTKNGINFAQPWILMRIPNMRSVFSHVEEPRIVYYRRKDA